MAVITNTFSTPSAVGIRQELSDVVSRITPEDTPILSLIEKIDFKTTHPEWETDTLAAPADNAQLEGDDYTFDNTTPPVKMGNYTQIFRKSGIISGSQEEIDEAGNIQKTKYQKLKKGVELRKDVELSIVSNTASASGTTRRTGGLPSWLTSNVARNSGSNGGFSQGSGLTVAATNGTQRALTKALTDNVMQQAYQNGANVSKMVVSPYVKSVFVTFMSDTNVATQRHAVDAGGKKTIIGNADIYEGPFGTVTVIPDRVMATSAAVARNAFLIDPEYLKFGWFRKIQNDPDVAKTGDAKKFVILGEGALKVPNEAGNGVIADLFGLTSAS